MKSGILRRSLNNFIFQLMMKQNILNKFMENCHYLVFSLVSGVCYKCLENQQIIRQKDDKDIIFQILGQLIKKCNHQLGMSFRNSNFYFM